EYRYYVPARFTRNLVVYADVYEKAQRLLEQGALKSIDLFDSYSDDPDNNGKLAVARGALDRDGVLIAEVTFSRDRVQRLRCPVYRCKGYFRTSFDRGNMEICEHCLALLIRAAEELREKRDWDATDRQARRLIDGFWNRYRDGALIGEDEAGPDRSGLTVRLEPRLEDTGDALELGFRIGTDDKLYVLKDPEALVEAVRDGSEFSPGSRLKLHFAVDRFGGTDRAYYDLIRQAVLEKQVHDPGTYGRTRKLQGIRLYGALLDDFYELALDRQLIMKTADGEKTTLHICAEAPQIRLELSCDETDDGRFHGMILRGELPRILDGVHARYCLMSGVLSRIDADRLRVLEPLLSDGAGTRLNMHIGRNFLSDFYYHVLPALSESADIDEPDRDRVLPYLPPEVQFCFYLDAVDGVPLCRPEARYGDADAFSVTDWVRESVPSGRGGTKEFRMESRDQMQESAVLLKLLQYFPDDRGNGELYATEDEDNIFRVLTEGVDLLWRLGEVMSTARFDALRVRRSVKVQVGVSLESDIMDLKISSEDVSPEELADILRSYRLKKKYHRLKNGDFVRMDDAIGELAALTDSLQLSKKDLLSGDISVPAYRALYLEQMLEQAHEIYAVRDRHFRSLVKDFQTVRDSDYEVPDELTPVLRGYQVYGYKWLRTLKAGGFGGILADEMGLGKTLQIIAVLLSAKLEGEIGTSLIVCPASLVYNWAEEFRRFAPLLTVCPVEGTQPERQQILARSGRWDVLISSYDHLKRDIPLYEDKLFLCEVLDEAQFIKNQSTAAAKAVKAVRAKHRFALTGTPIENRLSELWSIFDFLMPGFLYRYETFRNDFERPITRDGDEQMTARLRRMVAPFLLRRLKTEVLKDLPEKVEECRVVRFGEEQQRLYDAQVVRMKQMLDSETDESYKKSKIQILAELTRVRQICCDPKLLFDNYEGGSAKMEACLDLVHSAIEGEHRILLFSQFTSMLDLLKERLKQEDIRYYEITGATPKKERLRLVTDFNEGEVPLFLISLRAGGTGLNLTGADIVIHYDPWWNAAAQNQATDRAHRIGQQKPVTVYKLLAKDSIEEKIQQLQEKKLSLADEIISGDPVSFSSLSREDLLELIG
ncbi:MAG: DEAD/DEAH box helicase, partial [Candidatus Limivicinus sp.]